MSSCCFCRERLQWQTQGTRPLWEPSLGNHSPSRHPRFWWWYEIFFWLHHAPVVLNKASHKCALMSSSNVNILKSICYSFATFIPKLSVLQIFGGTRRVLWIQVVSTLRILTRLVNLGVIDPPCDFRFSDQPKECSIVSRGSTLTSL